MADRQNLLREGTIAGAIGATSVAVWFLILDTIAGSPFHTPRVLGSAFLSGFDPATAQSSTAMPLIVYTVFHYVAFVGLGIVAAALVRASQREPNIVAGLVVLFVAFEAGFYGLTQLLTPSERLSSLAWWQVGVANLLAAAVMGVYMIRAHPELKREFGYSAGRENTPQSSESA